MRIALGVSGGIACYKAAEILRLLQDRGHDVIVVMTGNAARFVTPLTFEALSGHPVYMDLWRSEGRTADARSFPEESAETEAGAVGLRQRRELRPELQVSSSAFDHIEVAQSIDLFLVAPATANCIAKFAAGLADDFFTTFHLAVQAPVVMAPAMNTRMWTHPSVQANLQTLEARGVRIIPPETGRMACRTYGPGRLASIESIVEFVETLIGRQDLKGRNILVTAGPTVEDIDPVRFISNRSSGKMGLAIARAARDRGGQVTLVSGPADLEFPNIVRVRSTAEMREAVLSRLHETDIVIKAAAPLDFRPKRVAERKVKKANAPAPLELERTPDILHEIGSRKNGKLLVGFAAETEDLAKNGRAKLKEKNLDLIVVNSVSGPDSAFAGDTNQALIIDAGGNVQETPVMSKSALADLILNRVVALLQEKESRAPRTP